MSFPEKKKNDILVQHTGEPFSLFKKALEGDGKLGQNSPASL
jgi:hypothetical protein